MKSRFFTRFCAFLLVIITLLAIHPAVFADEESEELLTEADAPSTGNVLVIKNLDTGTDLKLNSGSGSRIFQAGVSARLMTALVAYEQIGDLSVKISIPFCASDQSLRGSGSYMGFSYKEGTSYTLKELLSSATVSSHTDACLSLAVATIRHLNGEKTDLSGSYDEAAAASVNEKSYLNDFITLMNDRAARLGMKTTNYANVTGVTNTESHTTANDMSLLAAEICTNVTELYYIASQTNYTLGDSNNAIYTKNALINGYNLKGYTLEDAKGLAVGYMDNKDAFCVITTAERGGLSYVFVCINTTAEADPNATGKTYVAEDSAYKTIHNFMPWALKAFKYVTVLGVDSENADDLHAVASIPVKSGKNSSEVTIVTAHNVELLVSNDIDPETDIKVELPDFSKINLTAPVSKGQVVGTAKVFLKGELIDEVTLITNDGVEESTTLAAVDKAKNFLTSPLMVKIYKWALIAGGCYLLVTLILFIYRIVRKYVSAGNCD